MRSFYIQENGVLTVVQAQTVLQAAEHYARHHGWKLPQDALRLVKHGHWQMFGGDILVFDHPPAGVPLEGPLKGSA